MVRISASSPSPSRLALGSSSTTSRGLAVQGTRERDALALAAREHAAALADLGVVALGQAQDHLVRVGALRGLDDRLGVDIAQARDVLRHGPANSSTSCGR